MNVVFIFTIDYFLSPKLQWIPKLFRPPLGMMIDQIQAIIVTYYWDEQR